jgi:hypothetical protein
MNKDKILYLIEGEKEQLNYTIEYSENELKQLKLELKREKPILGYFSYLTETQKLNQQVSKLRTLFYILANINESEEEDKGI